MHPFRGLVESLEQRLLMTFAASLSSPIQAVKDASYTAYVHRTGSQSASSETFRFDDPLGGDVTVTNPAVLQAASHIYRSVNVPPDGTGHAVNANVTPSGGTQFNIPLTLNSNFGHGTGNSLNSGKFVSPPQGATSGNAYGMAGDGDGNLYVAGSYTDSGGNKPFAITKFDYSGAVVTAFGNNGTKTIAFDTGTDIAYDVMYIDGGASGAGDDTIVVAGTCASGWAVARLKWNPASQQVDLLDTSFDGDGKRSAFQAGELRAAGFQALGAPGVTDLILLAGRDNSSNMVVYALNDSDGSTAWSKTITFGTQYNFQEAYDVLSQHLDGKVVVAGLACRASPDSGNDFALARLNPSDGSFDTTFDGDGKVTTNFGCLISGSCPVPSYDTAYALVESVDDGRNSIYAVGKTNHSGADRFAVVSYLNSNGSRDPNFKKTGLPNGLSTGPLGTAYDARIQDVSAAPGYGMVMAVGGGTPGDTSSDFILARFKTVQSGETTGGALDADFGAAGAASTDFRKDGTYSTGYDVARRVRFALGNHADHTYSIIAAGFSGSTSTGGNIALAEYLPRNRIYVVSPLGGGGGAPMMAPFTAADDSTAPNGATSLLATDGEGNGLLSSA